MRLFKYFITHSYICLPKGQVMFSESEEQLEVDLSETDSLKFSFDRAVPKS